MLVCEGEIGELVQPGGLWGLPWGLLSGTSVRKKLCIVFCHSCHIYEIWTRWSKRCGGCLKVINCGWRKSQKGDSFQRKAGSHYVILLYCETLLQVLLGIYCNWFYWIPTSFHYVTVILCVWCWQDQNCNSKCPNYINIELGYSKKFFRFFILPLGNSRQNKASPLETPHNCVTPFRIFKT